jgi:hypothetical protein
MLARESMIFLLLLIFVLVTNYPAINYGAIHFEQVPIYFANQQIVSWQDLLNLYVHPQLFYAGSIPYFRPSGLFLIYQLLAPVLGWHNIQGFIIVNLIFLALTGYVTIKLYNRLFPKAKMGGYLGFALYAMHPALVFSHLMVIHFEYSYIFFSVLSIYWFVLFCQNHAKRRSFYFLAGSLLSYAMAVTFKETAIMTTVVSACYLTMFFYRDLLRHTKMRYVLGLLAIYTLCFVAYLSVNDTDILTMSYIEFKLANNIPYYLAIIVGLASHPGDTYWTYRDILIPWLAQFILVLSFLFLIAASIKIDKACKKPLQFLLAAAGIFFIFPLFLGASPWHLSLSLLFLTMALGFGIDTICLSYLKPVFFILIGFCAFLVLQVNIHNGKDSIYNFALQLNRNAILHAPPIKNLKSNSIILVEDSQPLGAYLLGSSQYPVLQQDAKEQAKTKGKKYFIHPEGFYNGMLFRMAYLMSSLREEVYPFQVNQLQKVPDEIFNNWWLNVQNIYCVGYDRSGNWHDLTTQFQVNLLREHARRQLAL